ncbi:MAG: 3-methyl-2-oxobutanoate hydroxymethyltransferase [Chthonomonadaceae bacterium]|nr:3-methyl-2-oxobutanoate hydroxymethyltransferase [Chthonomonadaceae bacterium]
MKGSQKVVCVTAYDASTARIAEEAGVDLILVGDSLGNVVLGYESTLPVTLEEMLHHTRAVARTTTRALVIGDMPFGSYQASLEDAMRAAAAFLKAGAHGVKLEGAYPELVREMVRAGIPVMGHVGMTPQSVHAFGGFRVQGKGAAGDQVADAARGLADAGSFSLVLELVPAALAARITSEVACPTIGIGAGAGCDGQIQVFHDLLGLSPVTLKHAKTYVEGQRLLADGLRAYADEVREGEFPGEEHSF